MKKSLKNLFFNRFALILPKTMIMLRLVTFTVTLFIMTGCNTGSSDNSVESTDPFSFIEIDERQSVGDKEIKLSDLVESYEVVRFEDCDSALFRPWKTSVSDNYIVIVQGGMSTVMLFDKKGRFINTVGRPGMGPGEYQYVYNALIDEDRGSIFVVPWYSPQPTLEYDLKGNFRRSHNIPKIAKSVFFNNADGTISAASLTFKDQDDTATALTFNPETDSIKSVFYPALSVPLLNDAQVAVGLENDIWAFRNVTTNVFMTTSNDTLYAYDPVDNKIHPRAFLKEKDVKEPGSWYVGMELPQSIVFCVNGSDARSIWYDKDTGEVSNAALVNDYMGNATFSISNFRDGYFVQIWEPGQLLDRIEERWLPKNNMSDQQRRDLEKFRDSIDPDSNNIMLIGKLKR